MTKFLFKNARFIKTAVGPKDFPKLVNLKGHPLPEIAVAGRSNVGKSSLLNSIFQAKGMVKTSSTPGKTQALNFFTLNEEIAFVDLPGYGYAKVPDSLRKNWGPLIQNYLENRKELKIILFLFDIRRIPNEEDLQLMDWIIYNQKAALLVFTKVDKVNQNERTVNTKKILEAFNVQNLHYIHYSVPKDEGRRELMAIIKDALHDEK